MKKKILTILFGCALILSVSTACGTKEEQKPKESEQEVSRGKCEVAECMTMLNPEMSVEQVNEVIGFTGEKSATEEKYTWQLTKKTKIEIEYKEGKGSIKATYNKENLKNEKLKLSLCYDIVNHIKEQTYTYQEMVEKLEGIEGNLESYSPTSKMYSWVNKEGQTFRATFSENKGGKCSITSIQ